MEKFLAHVGASQTTTIYWLVFVFDTNMNTPLLDRTLCAYVTGYYPPFDPAMDIAAKMSLEEEGLSWVKQAVVNAVTIGDEFHPVQPARIPVLRNKEFAMPGEDLPVLYGQDGIDSPLNSVAISFKRKLTQQETLQLYARAQEFATAFYEARDQEPLVILGYRVIEERRTEICTDAWFEEVESSNI